MSIKLDMSKAYDRVESTFLEKIMRKLGFAYQWIALIMTCVRTVSYSVLINGAPFGMVTPTRGLKQGDPLSSYLFLLCTEGLSSLLMRAEQDGSNIGVPISARGFQMSHFFFANDSLLYCQANF